MTYNELREEVAALGFESEIDSDVRLLTATRRALAELYTERPTYATLSLYKIPTAPVSKLDKLLHCGGVTYTVPFSACAYSFRTSGNGEFRITDGGGERGGAFSGEGVLHRGFLHGDGRLEFLGEYSYAVYDLAFYGEIYGATEEDIPDASGYTVYDVKKLAGDFLSFAYPPTDDGGSSIEGASVRGGKMKIPDAYCGKVDLIYKCAPCEVTGKGDGEITVPDGCRHLLPLLVASYVWLDDDGEKAERYASLYRDALSAVKYYERPHIDASYGDVNGWA